MTIRQWVVQQLNDDSPDNHRVRGAIKQIELVGDSGVRVVRTGRQTAVAHCVEPSNESFDTEDLQGVAQGLPDARFVIVVRRPVGPDVYELARERGTCVDTFGGFCRAIVGYDDVGQYVHPEEQYFRRRLNATRAVTVIRRKGHRAWEIVRKGGLRTLTVATHDRYELTDDGFASVMAEYPDLDLDALVVTNSSAGGFGQRVVRSAERAGVPLYTFPEFLDDIRKPWT